MIGTGPTDPVVMRAGENSRRQPRKIASERAESSGVYSWGSSRGQTIFPAIIIDLLDGIVA